MNNNIMAKDLAISIQKDFNHILIYAFPLCVVLSNEKFLGWYYENYIGIYGCLSSENNLRVDIFDALTYTCIENNLIDNMYKDLDAAEQIDDIIEELINKIYFEYYPIIFLDYYYLSCSDYFQKKHYTHEFLIYGFDSYTKKFKAVAFDENRIFNSIELNYSDVSNAFNSALNDIKNRTDYTVDDRFLMYFKLREHHKEYPFNLNKFYKKLNRYNKAQFYEHEIYFAKLYDINNMLNLEYGINVYNIFINYLKELLEIIKLSPVDFVKSLSCKYNCIHLFYQHKLSLYKRLTNIISSFDISKELENAILKYEEISDSVNSIRLIWLKIEYYDYSNIRLEELIKKGTNIINELIDELRILKLKEQIIINEILELMRAEDHLIKEY